MFVTEIYERREDRAQKILLPGSLPPPYIGHHFNVRVYVYMCSIIFGCRQPTNTFIYAHTKKYLKSIQTSRQSGYTVHLNLAKPLEMLIEIL